MLKDFIDFNPRETLPKGQPAKKVAMEKLRPFCRDIEEFEVAKYSGGAKFRNGDTLLARITPCLENGKTAQVRFLNDGELGFGSTEYIVLRAKEGVSDSDYIYYLSTSPKFREIAIQSMVGSSGRQRVQQDVLEKAELHIPPLDEQRKIAGVLSALDDKIELNNKINRNLEAQAQAIFKSWFEKIENSKKVTLDYFCDIFTGKKNANAAVKNGKYKFFTCSPEILLTNTFIFDGPGIIISGNGSYTGRTRFFRGKFDLYQRTYVCTIKPIYQESYIYLLYLAVKTELEPKLMGGTHGSAIPYIVMNDIAKFELNYNEDVYLKLSKCLKPLVDNMLHNEIESQYLSILRNTLLPKLMSGEIDVTKITV